MGSEQAVIRSSKDLIEDRPSKSGSNVFDRGSFRNFTSNKFKDLLLNEGTIMEQFLDEMEAAVSKRCAQEQKQLQKTNVRARPRITDNNLAFGYPSQAWQMPCSMYHEGGNAIV